MKVMIHFLDAFSGPLKPWVPLMYFPTPFFYQANLSCLHPSGKGRGRCSGVGISKQVWVFEFKPTSLNRGEGLISEFQYWFEGEMGGESDGMGEE